MRQKNVLITGANTGMGYATTVELARQGYHVIMACRSKERGEEALEKGRQESGVDHIELMICDLGSLDSIRAFVKTFKVKYDVLDVLINNAGVVALKRETTRDGFESMMGVNHLGHFLLTNMLLVQLKAAEQGRIIVLSSGAYKIGKIHFEDPSLIKGFNVFKGYAQSKLANVLFMTELAHRLENSKVTVNAVHPGAVSTDLGVNRKTGFGKMVHGALRPLFKTPTQGAATAIYLATSPEVEAISGAYFMNKKKTTLTKKATDLAMADKLWQWSDRAVELNEY